ncbi:hypothetical protein NEF87_002665 [Candidatus Lokiarchaeum ossiferum]|uniref:RING-type domain-containing protein n=1 Tax=Candidatus Lokiarchaeum ossiferum TaxID=2951803 RepID=A0ABY6HS92_9ARCH|nr:hypothetical protein NEF87_002665 [Candidatus Lokiarchaeum sp. B-35]
MAKKSKQGMMNIKPLVFKGSKDLIQAISSTIEGIQATKVIQTYVMENNNLKLAVGKDGKGIFAGTVKWIGNRTDGMRGTVFCVQKSAKDGEIRLIIPTEDTAQDIGLDAGKSTIKINSKESLKCSVCGKGIKIFDEVLACPLCNSKAHSDHLLEWINMRHSCPICKKGLGLDNNNAPIPTD